jgi:hypothetical protein
VRERAASVANSPLLHVLGLATFPIVFLWAHNQREQIDLTSVLGPLAVTWLVVLVLFSCLRLFVDPLRAGMLTSLIAILFFSFGHLRTLVDPFGIGTKDPWLLVEWALLLLIGSAFIMRVGRYASGVTRALNLVAVGLVLINLWPATGGAGFDGRALSRIDVTGLLPEGAEPSRDVYYLVFDRYADAITLRDLYGFDNSPFLDFLRSEGFFVAEDSLANYPTTAHSLAASLNMSYLDGLAREEGRDSGDWEPIFNSLQGSKVASAFQHLGYRYEHVGSWWEPTRIDPEADRSHPSSGLSEFSSVLLDTTMWPALGPVLGLAGTFEERQREAVLFQFDTIRRIAADPAPTFTFVHFTLPHPPYVFGADGEFISGAPWTGPEGRRAYVEQLRYTNSRIRRLLAVLLSGTDDRDPIVVIQSDEGPHPEAEELDVVRFDWTRASDVQLGQKMRILNALYLPGRGAEPYAAISPVNSFRLILARYFGAGLPLLDDRAFVFQDRLHPYRLTEVTDRFRQDVAALGGD